MESYPLPPQDHVITFNEKRDITLPLAQTSQRVLQHNDTVFAVHMPELKWEDSQVASVAAPMIALDTKSSPKRAVFTKFSLFPNRGTLMTSPLEEDISVEHSTSVPMTGLEDNSKQAVSGTLNSPSRAESPNRGTLMTSPLEEDVSVEHSTSVPMTDLDDNSKQAASRTLNSPSRAESPNQGTLIPEPLMLDLLNANMQYDEDHDLPSVATYGEEVESVVAGSDLIESSRSLMQAMHDLLNKWEGSSVSAIEDQHSESEDRRDILIDDESVIIHERKGVDAEFLTTAHEAISDTLRSEKIDSFDRSRMAFDEKMNAVKMDFAMLLRTEEVSDGILIDNIIKVARALEDLLKEVSDSPLRDTEERDPLFLGEALSDLEYLQSSENATVGTVFHEKKAEFIRELLPLKQELAVLELVVRRPGFAEPVVDNSLVNRDEIFKASRDVLNSLSDILNMIIPDMNSRIADNKRIKSLNINQRDIIFTLLASKLEDYSLKNCLCLYKVLKRGNHARILWNISDLISSDSTGDELSLHKLMQGLMKEGETDYSSYLYMLPEIIKNPAWVENSKIDNFIKKTLDKYIKKARESEDESVDNELSQSLSSLPPHDSISIFELGCALEGDNLNYSVKIEHMANAIENEQCRQELSKLFFMLEKATAGRKGEWYRKEFFDIIVNAENSTEFVHDMKDLSKKLDTTQRREILCDIDALMCDFIRIPHSEHKAEPLPLLSPTAAVSSRSR